MSNIIMMLDKTFIWSQGYNSEEKSLYYDLGIHQLESFDQLQSWFDKRPKGGGFHLTAWATAILSCGYPTSYTY